ncbi:MAG: geranylgeranylglycerol-phosphate geranylgeranyltransferase [Flavobacteriaceae bacterium]|nr:geranylgeranylglycerol-phosphate geranylgeranyltransferase [Flavobacteriaceae bacterium]
MKLLPFLQLIRWKNLVILATALLVIKYGFINVFTDESALNNLQFVLFLCSILLIAAAGYIINDIYDIETDTINKPSKVFIGTVLSINQAYNFYFLFNIIGVILGFLVVNFLQKPIFSSIYIIGSFVLYYYSTTLKRMPVIGNFVVAFFISFTLITLAYFDLILVHNTDNLGFHYLLFELIFEFSIFAFMINFIREIVKDLEDIEGDNYLQMKTLPILIGIKYSKVFIEFLSLLLIIALTYFVISYLQFNSIIFYYFLIFIAFPLFYFCIKLYYSETKSDFNFLSKILKVCMLSGIIAIIFISLSIKNVI